MLFILNKTHQTFHRALREFKVLIQIKKLRKMSTKHSNLDSLAVEKLIQYLKIKTVHPKPDYAGAIQFLKGYATEAGFDSFREVQVAPDRTVCILSYNGTKPELKSVLLNSHTDVVPVDQKYWKCDAFEGKRYENGDIYGRGVQDMKFVRRMKLNGIRPDRSIHLSFCPDEEIGGLTGFSPFLETQEFADLNVGFALDEGQASANEEFCLYYTERLHWSK